MNVYEQALGQHERDAAEISALTSALLMEREQTAALREALARVEQVAARCESVVDPEPGEEPLTTWGRIRRSEDRAVGKLIRAALAGTETPLAEQEIEPWVLEADALTKALLDYLMADQRDDHAACQGKSVSGIAYGGMERAYAAGRAAALAEAAAVCRDPYNHDEGLAVQIEAMMDRIEAIGAMIHQENVARENAEWKARQTDTVPVPRALAEARKRLQAAVKSYLYGEPAPGENELDAALAASEELAASLAACEEAERAGDKDDE